MEQGVGVSFDNLNIVLAGSNFPVGTVRATDFDFPGAVVQVPRLPMLDVIQTGNFNMQVLPIRCQITATTGDDPDDKVAVLMRNAISFSENYIGPRAVTAVGHNFQSHISSTQLSKNAIFVRLLNPESINRLVEGVPDVLADVVLQFKRGSADYVRLTITTTRSPEDRILIDFNFNYDMTRADAAPLQEVIALLPESLHIAQQIEEQLPAILEMQEAQ